MKETYYFQHDYNATQDPKIMVLLSRCGLQGLGAYWMLIETMHQQKDSMITREAMHGYLSFYMPLVPYSDDAEHLLNKIEQELFNTKLFVEQDGNVFSNRVIENKKQREIISEKRSLAGKKSAKARKEATSVEQTVNKGQQGKKRKEKEIKENLIITEPSSETGKAVNKVLDVFFEINPGINYANNTNRKSASWLVEKFGEEKAVAYATAAKVIQGKKYAPTITTPTHLKEKLGELDSFYKKETNKITPIV